jgi:ATP-dependent DNA ligase
MLRGARTCHHRRMASDWDLPINPPVPPMLAAPSASEVPEDPHLAFEPKWDGFRALVFRAGERVCIQGRGGDDLAYAFPEAVAALRDCLPDRVVLDGELVVVHDGVLDFTALGSRLRPRSESRSIQALAAQHPTTFVAFDILALGTRALLDETYLARRGALVGLGIDDPRVRITPMTRDHIEAVRWFHEFEGGGLDGLIAKPVDSTYQPGKRAMRKIKHRRTLDVVVAGWRAHAKDPEQIASLLLGLYDEHGRLHHVGAASGLSAARRRELTEDLRPLMLPDSAEHPWRDDGDTREVGQSAPVGPVRRPGGINRWSRGREQAWHALRPDRVAEVTYDQFEGDRLRHVASWLRWRPDRAPSSCTYAQMPSPDLVDIDAILRPGT